MNRASETRPAVTATTPAPAPPAAPPRFHFRFPGRFEWKVLAAVFIVATLPLGATWYFLSQTLATVAAINSRHQQEVRGSLGETLESFRITFAQEKEAFRARAEELAGTHVARAADLAGTADLLRARILVGDAVMDEWTVSPAEFQRTREAPPNLVELSGSRPDAPRMLELTFGIDRQVYTLSSIGPSFTPVVSFV